MGYKLFFFNENQVKCCSSGKMKPKIVAKMSKDNCKWLIVACSCK